jgi:4-amino-4-deoxychorismate lyase
VRAALVNGVAPADAASAVAIADRGLNYGDGLFETMALREGKVRLLDAHMTRLASGCARLKIGYPGTELLLKEIAGVTGTVREGVVKVIVTRGSAGRGYRPDANAASTRIVTLHELPPASKTEIKVRWCEMRLSRNPALAGIKHLNRLEQVLAQGEWNDAQIEEGLMLDYEDELVCGTSSNIFIVRGRELMTPDLRYCGVRGVMRGEVVKAAMQLGIEVHEEPLWADNLETANEVFVTNAVRGIRSVVMLDALTWSNGPVTQAIRKALEKHA